LQTLLQNGKNVKGEIILPETFPRRVIPFSQIKFVSIPKIDFELFNLSRPERPEIDKIHYQKQFEKNMSMLKVQQQTSRWLDKIETELQSGNQIVFEEWLDKIIDTENNLEVPIQVCYGLIQNVNKNKNAELKITKETVLSIKSDLQLWKMRVQTTRS
jgi:hypothetical protein